MCSSSDAQGNCFVAYIFSQSWFKYFNYLRIHFLNLEKKPWYGSKSNLNRVTGFLKTRAKEKSIKNPK